MAPAAKIKWRPEDNRPPKKALTAYMYFIMEEKSKIVQENPDLNFGQIMRFVAKQWNSMSALEKSDY